MLLLCSDMVIEMLRENITRRSCFQSERAKWVIFTPHKRVIAKQRKMCFSNCRPCPTTPANFKKRGREQYNKMRERIPRGFDFRENSAMSSTCTFSETPMWWWYISKDLAELIVWRFHRGARCRCPCLPQTHASATREIWNPQQENRKPLPCFEALLLQDRLLQWINLTT